MTDSFQTGMLSVACTGRGGGGSSLIKADQSNWAPEIPFKMKIRTRQTHASLVLEYNTDCKNSKYNTLKEDQQQAPNEPFTTLCVIWSRAALMLHSRAFTLTSYSTTSIKPNHRPTAYNKSMVHFLKGFLFYVFCYTLAYCVNDLKFCTV